jgi:hypothetical protein
LLFDAHLVGVVAFFSENDKRSVFSSLKRENIKESNLTINWFHIAAKQTTKTAILFEGIEKS